MDCQSFAGGFAMGVVRAGFELVGKREHKGAFGTAAMDGNRHLLGHDWKAEDGPADTWTALDADLVFGNPPCSGFSALTTSFDQEWRDKQKECMVDFVRFAAKCKPRVVIMESVQQAYKNGRELMLDLRKMLEEDTGVDWTLYHVLHNVADLGGSQLRPRYFWVAARIPFGVSITRRPPKTVRDTIGDIEFLGSDDVQGHEVLNAPRVRKLANLAMAAEWREGERSGCAFERNPTVDVYGSDKNPKGGFCAIRLAYDKPSRVIDGMSPMRFMHPSQPRVITLREVARISGFPDEWTVAPYQKPANRFVWFGKGITVQAGTWIATMAREALLGQARPHQGTLIGDREYLIDNGKDLA
jgi:DNA (cytosine-5)-methyltransferase 1